MAGGYFFTKPLPDETIIKMIDDKYSHSGH